MQQYGVRLWRKGETSSRRDRTAHLEDMHVDYRIHTSAYPKPLALRTYTRSCTRTRHEMSVVSLVCPVKASLDVIYSGFTVVLSGP